MRTTSTALLWGLLLTAIIPGPRSLADELNTAPAPAARQTDEAQEGTSPVSRCGELCHKLYGSEPANRQLCEEGCAAAEHCTNRCNEEFAGDGDKLARCNYRCARAR